jgi:hydroxymethylpyrimidine pyrophosphatase-like HAD family hydrolase
MPRVREACDSRGWPLRVSRTRYYVNCDLDFVSKGTAIDRLCAEVGLKRARLAGIGDSESDLAIRERVAFFGCPANAVEPLRSVADYVSPYHLAEGVIDILRRLRDGQAG